MPSATQPGERLRQIDDTAPTLTNREVGCAFRPRCQYAQPRCAKAPPSVTVDGTRNSRCYFPIHQEVHAWIKRPRRLFSYMVCTKNSANGLIWLNAWLNEWPTALPLNMCMTC